MSTEQIPFSKGQTVRTKLTKKLGTVVGIPEAAGEGLVEVRFDGDTGSVQLHHSRFEPVPVVHIDLIEYHPYLFQKGDFIRVTDQNGCVYPGTAMTDLEEFGTSHFQLLTSDGKLIDFNYNMVDVINLFRATVARGEDPKY